MLLSVLRTFYCHAWTRVESLASFQTPIFDGTGDSVFPYDLDGEFRYSNFSKVGHLVKPMADKASTVIQMH